MRIKKTLFSTEIEFTPTELAEIAYKPPPWIRRGILHWLKRNFDLDMLRRMAPKKEENDQTTQ